MAEKTKGIPPLIEPTVVPDVFVSGVHAIQEMAGGCVRMTLYVDQEIDGAPARVVVERLVMATTTMDEIHASVAMRGKPRENRFEDPGSPLLN